MSAVGELTEAQRFMLHQVEGLSKDHSDLRILVEKNAAKMEEKCNHRQAFIESTDKDLAEAFKRIRTIETILPDLPRLSSACDKLSDKVQTIEKKLAAWGCLIAIFNAVITAVVVKSLVP